MVKETRPLIDIHCHILPGLDDGPATMEEAIEMARIAWNDGITDVIATPHTHDDVYRNGMREIEIAVKSFQIELYKEGIPIRIHPGAEVHIHLDMIHNLNFNQISSLCHQMKHVLLELPSLHLPQFTDDLILELLSNGITPIIAHPERNEVLRNNPNRLARWITEGAMSQVTAGSLLGFMGKSTKQTSHKMVKQRLVHIVASDGHNSTTRKVELSHAYRVLSDLLPENEVEVFSKHAKAILSGESCSLLKPQPQTRKRLWFF